MGFWSELLVKLEEGEELNPDEEIALSNWIRQAGDEGLEFLKRNYPQSLELFKELERRMEWRI